MAKLQSGEEIFPKNLNRLSRAHERYRRQTTRICDSKNQNVT